MYESILDSIKKLLNISEEDTAFDTDLIIHINTVLGIVNQLGVGKEGFTISDNTAVWKDFIPTLYHKLVMVKTLVYLRVRLIFDPPTVSSVLESNNKLIEELECRLTYVTDS